MGMMPTWNKGAANILVFMGVFELALAAMFAVLAIAIPEAMVGMAITAVILGSTGVGLLIWGRKAKSGYDEAQRILTTGVSGRATIVGLNQTGIQVNDQPVVDMTLQVEAPGIAPITVTRREVVPLMLLGRLTDGRPIPVKLDPQFPESVAIDWEHAMDSGPLSVGNAPMPSQVTPEAVAAVASAGGLPSESDLEYRRTRLRTFGKEGVAVVQSAQPTGTTVGRFPVYIVDLVITVDGTTTDLPASAAAIPPEHTDKVTAGMIVPLFQDRDDPTQVSLAWEDAKPPSV